MLLAVSLFWMSGELFLPRSSRLRPWFPSLVMALALVVAYDVQTESVPQWSFGESIRERGVFEENTTYFAVLSRDDVFADIPVGGPIDASRKPVSYFGNTPGYASLRFVNGYDSTGSLPGYSRLFGMEWIGFTEDPAHIINACASSRGLLRLLGVDGLILGRHEMFDYAASLEKQGWKCVAKSGYGAVFHRRGPRVPRVRSVTDVEWVKDAEEMLDRLTRPASSLPNVLVAAQDPKIHMPPVLAKADISDVLENRLSVRCTVFNPSAVCHSLVAFSRAWYPGYRAFLDGDELPVRLLNALQVAVMIPPGARGRLHLAFMPTSLVLGCGFALGGLLVAVGFLVGPLAVRRSRAAVSSHEGTEG
jgi:hypothetical protein